MQIHRQRNRINVHVFHGRFIDKVTIQWYKWHIQFKNSNSPCNLFPNSNINKIPIVVPKLITIT
jgi:hypothetical protein